uniref:tRNA pseudouridine synthase n=1 Tax=Caenorhabditis tropicalis TaxID=1561998 RepID=A0A1I7T4A9_9PELO
MKALLKTKIIDSWENCEFSRCGRTDKGVSAFKQTAAFVARSNCPEDPHVFWPPSTPDEIKNNYKSKEELPYIKMLNGCLPKTIRVFAWAPVSQSFNARFDCNRRTYKYSFAKADLDLERIHQGAQLLIGEYDFQNFCQLDLNEKRLNQSMIRKIYDVTVKQISQHPDNDIYSMVELTVAGSGFLWHQIRYIVTILQEIGRGNEEPSLVSDLLDLEIYTARPHYTLSSDTPLCLFDCGYKDDDVKWIHDSETIKKTVSGLQKTWAAYQARSRMMENMIGELTQMTSMTSEDVTKGLHEFVQDRPIPQNYMKFENREMCDTLEVKRQKFKAKIEEKSKGSDEKIE